MKNTHATDASDVLGVLDAMLAGHGWSFEPKPPFKLNQYGASLGILDYSRKDTDDFGNYTLVERGFSRTGSYRVQIAAGLVDEFERLMSTYRATPILYIMTDTYASTAVFGIYRSFNVEIAYLNYSLASLELEGLT